MSKKNLCRKPKQDPKTETKDSAGCLKECIVEEETIEQRAK